MKTLEGYEKQDAKPTGTLDSGRTNFRKMNVATF